MPGSRRLTPRAIALLVVVTLHVMLGALMVWVAKRPATKPTPPTRVTLTLRPSMRPPVPAPAIRVSPDAATPSRRIAAAPVPRPTDSHSPQSITPPLEGRSEAAASPPDTPASQPPRPLDLTLRRSDVTRPGARNPAIDDPRANTARTTPEQRMTATLDTRVIEEDLGDGRRRFRQGDQCVIVQPSRIGQLRPFDDAAARSPSLVGACP